MPPPTLQQQAELIGAFVLNFGAAEIATFQWITVFSSDVIVRDMAIDMTFSKRIALVCDLVKRSNLPPDKKKRALEIWAQVNTLSKTRNKVAHSPTVQNPSKAGEWGLIDVKKMKGPGPYQIEPLEFEQIAREGSQLARILPELIEILGTNTQSGKRSK